MAPNSSVLPPHMHDDEEENGDSTTLQLDEMMHSAESGAQKTRKKGELLPRKKKAKRITTAAKLIKTLDKIMEAVTSDSLRSVESSGSRSQSTIRDCLEIMKSMFGLEVGDPLYLFGAHLFKKTADGEMFAELPAETRLAWLEAEKSIFNRR